MSKYVVSRLSSELGSSTRAVYDNLIDKSTIVKPLVDKGPVIEIGATLSGQPIGILRVTFIPALFYAEVNALFVEEEHRKHGIATEMFVCLQKELKKEKCPVLICEYPSGKITTSDLEEILKQLNWEGPRLLTIHCKFDATIFHPPWLDKAPPLPEGFHEFPWDQLTEIDRSKLMHQEEREMFPLEVSPFGSKEKDIEMSNSLGLRYKGEVVGWMVTHRKAPDLITYTCFYIQKRWQMTGVAVKLLCDSIQLQLRGDVKWAALEVNMEKTEPSWMRFLERRLIPYAQEVHYTKCCWLNLG